MKHVIARLEITAWKPRLKVLQQWGCYSQYCVCQQLVTPWNTWENSRTCSEVGAERMRLQESVETSLPEREKKTKVNSGFKGIFRIFITWVEASIFSPFFLLFHALCIKFSKHSFNGIQMIRLKLGKLYRISFSLRYIQWSICQTISSGMVYLRIEGS